MLIVGLTGGIASGKSTVERLFAAHDVPVIDADRIARDLVQPGEPGLEAIVHSFGTEVLTPDGQLDRNRLGDRVFANPAQRRRLETLLHPLVREKMRAAVDRLQSAYVILSVPLLLESGQDDMVDRILVVDLPQQTQRQRLLARDRRPVKQVEAILAAQADRQARLQVADDLIDNSGPIGALASQVATLHQRYLTISGHPSEQAHQ